MDSSEFHIRMAVPGDAPQMLAIYGPVVRETAISFETDPPTQEKFSRRIAETLQSLPWLVCVCDNRIVGYAYATTFRSRSGYRWSVEVSVYVSLEYRRRGVGAALYGSLFQGLWLLGYYNAYAGISLPNPASVNLHESMGFLPVGIFPSVGFKLGEWHDIGFWCLTLQPHDAKPPPPKPLNHLLNNPEWPQSLKSASASIGACRGDSS